jgi:hypothetical protein
MFKLMMIATLFLTGLAALGGAQVADEPGSSSAQSAPANETWRKEFDDICSKTEDAMTLPLEELVSRIDRCDALQPKIEKLDETPKKVYLKRLRTCRGLYAYVLESKQNEKK